MHMLRGMYVVWRSPDVDELKSKRHREMGWMYEDFFLTPCKRMVRGN